MLTTPNRWTTFSLRFAILEVVSGAERMNEACDVMSQAKVRSVQLGGDVVWVCAVRVTWLCTGRSTEECHVFRAHWSTPSQRTVTEDRHRGQMYFSHSHFLGHLLRTRLHDLSHIFATRSTRSSRPQPTDDVFDVEQPQSTGDIFDVDPGLPTPQAPESDPCQELSDGGSD